MGGMLRLKNEEELTALLKGSSLKVARGIVGGVPFQSPAEREQKEAAQGRRQVGRLAPAPKAPKPPKPASDIEELLARQIAESNLPAPIREYPYLRGRAHRLDFAWPQWRYQGMQLGLEVQGMVHRAKGRFSADLEKRALSLLQQWAILEVGGEHIRDGRAMTWLHQLFSEATKQ